MDSSRGHLEIEKAPRNFRLDEVLTIVSGVVFIDFHDDPDPNAFTRRIGDLLSFLTGEGQLETHQLPRIANEVRASILEQAPEVAALLTDMPEEETGSDAEFRAWYAEVMQLIASDTARMIPLSQMEPIDHTSIEPAMEFKLMGGAVIELSE